MKKGPRGIPGLAGVDGPRGFPGFEGGKGEKGTNNKFLFTFISCDTLQVTEFFTTIQRQSGKQIMKIFLFLFNLLCLNELHV